MCKRPIQARCLTIKRLLALCVCFQLFRTFKSQRSKHTMDTFTGVIFTIHSYMSHFTHCRLIYPDFLSLKSFSYYTHVWQWTKIYFTIFTMYIWRPESSGLNVIFHNIPVQYSLKIWARKKFHKSFQSFKKITVIYFQWCIVSTKEIHKYFKSSVGIK